MREFLLTVLFSLSILPVHTEATQPLADKQPVVVCERPEAVGLYKQCYEASLLERMPTMARVYSLPERKVLTVPIERLFLPKNASNHSELKPGQSIAIPGRFLWNTAPEGFQSLCNLDDLSPQSSFLTVSCGRYQKEKILKDHALSLKPIQ